MKILNPIGKSKNVIATIAIGGDYYEEWIKYAYPSWKNYCERYDLGLIVFDKDLIPIADEKWKKATWQKMLIADRVERSTISVNNVCYLDTDILINEYAPNVFDGYDNQTIGLVSQVKNIPFDPDWAHRRISFLRHTHYDSQYPLDSSIFMPVSEIYKYHGVMDQGDYACMGLILFNVKEHSKLMRGWFEKYDRNVDSITGGGDEPHINFEIQNWGRVTWLDYKFQALWIYEISTKYPFLYDYGRDSADLIQECVESSLIENYFLHFAGSWYESEMWKLSDVLSSNDKKKETAEYYNYLNVEVSGKPKGQIKPNCN